MNNLYDILLMFILGNIKSCIDFYDQSRIWNKWWSAGNQVVILNGGKFISVSRLNRWPHFYKHNSTGPYINICIYLWLCVCVARKVSAAIPMSRKRQFVESWRIFTSHTYMYREIYIMHILYIYVDICVCTIHRKWNFTGNVRWLYRYLYGCIMQLDILHLHTVLYVRLR